MKESLENPEQGNANWMIEALEEAKRAASEDEVPVGAIVIHQGKIIGRGYNRREQTQNPITHAEILAIQEASKVLNDWRLIDCTLVVTLEPCPMCLAASQQSRIGEIIYGTEDPKGGALSLGYTLHEDKRLNHRFPVLLEKTPACAEILKEFFRKKRKNITPG